jgi:hypothetical protein
MDNMQVASDIFTATILMQSIMIGAFSLMIYRKLSDVLQTVNTTLNKIDVKISNQ